MRNYLLVAAATTCLACWLAGTSLAAETDFNENESSSNSDISTTTTTPNNSNLLRPLWLSSNFPRQKEHTDHHQQTSPRTHFLQKLLSRTTTHSIEPSSSKSGYHHQRSGPNRWYASHPGEGSRNRPRIESIGNLDHEYPSYDQLSHHISDEDHVYPMHRGLKIGDKQVDDNEVNDEVNDDIEDNNNSEHDDGDDGDDNETDDDETSMITRKTSTTTATTTFSELPNELVSNLDDQSDDDDDQEEDQENDENSDDSNPHDRLGDQMIEHIDREEFRDEIHESKVNDDGKYSKNWTDQDTNGIGEMDDDSRTNDIVTGHHEYWRDHDLLVSTNEIPDSRLESKRIRPTKRKVPSKTGSSLSQEPIRTIPYSMKVSEIVAEQVPEDRMTIVVSSSSDNSYVSSSPIINNERHLSQGHHLRESNVEVHSQTTKNPATTVVRHEKQFEARDGSQNEPDSVSTIVEVEQRFEVNQATIIKTAESMESGASFINYTFVTNFNACLVECWIIDSCDTAIYQDSPVDLGANNTHDHQHHIRHHEQLHRIRNNHRPLSHHYDEHHRVRRVVSRSTPRHQDMPHGHPEEQLVGLPLDQTPNSHVVATTPKFEATTTTTMPPRSSSSYYQSFPELFRGFHICYLFECAKPDGYKCQFSAHSHYISSTRKMAGHRIGPLTKEHQFDELLISGPSLTHAKEPKPHFSRIIARDRHHYSIGKWHDSHIASISIEQEEHFDNLGPGGLNSAIIALFIGMAATGMLIFLVGLKMNSIRRRFIMSRRHRQSLVPDTEFFVNSLASHR